MSPRPGSPEWPLPDVAQTVYLTLQADPGLETSWQWPLEMYEAVPNVSRQSDTGKGVIGTSCTTGERTSLEEELFVLLLLLRPRL
jgi:hypothetical protein